MGIKTVGRRKELDLIRGFAVVCVLAVHLFYTIYAKADVPTDLFSRGMKTLAYSSVGTQTFMFILGMNTVLSKNATPNKLFKRGLLFFLLSWPFQIVFIMLPYLVCYGRVMSFKVAFGEINWLIPDEILAFSGLAFMFIALAEKLKIKDWMLAVIAVILSVLNTFLSIKCPLDTTANLFPNSFLSIIYFTSQLGGFPFMGWIIFPVFGRIFMNMLKKTEDENKFFKICGLVGFGMLIVVYYLSKIIFKTGPLVSDFTTEEAYCRMSVVHAFANIFAVVAWISFGYFIVRKVPEKVFLFFQRWSRNITSAYSVSWVIINYIFVLILGDTVRVRVPVFLLLTAVLCAVTDVLILLINKFIINKKKESKRGTV